MHSTAPDAEPTTDFEDSPTYTFKPSLIGAGQAFRLAVDALEWQVGRHSGRIPYREISRVRLSFRPVTMAPRRFLAEIWSKNSPKMQIASTSWRSMVEVSRQDAQYAIFIDALHHRLHGAGSEAAFETGKPPWLYWPGAVIFAGLTLALAFLVVRALQADAKIAAALVVGFLAFSLWQIGDFFRRNRPGTYSAGAVPPQVLPR